MYVESLSNVANGFVQVSGVSQEPHEKESTDSQDAIAYYSGGGYPWGYSGRSTAPLGTLDTYRWMDRHPTLALAKAVTTTPFIGAPYSVEADEGVPDEWVTCVEKGFLDQMLFLSRDAADAFSLRWQPFEVYWEPREDFMLPVFKPLLQELTAVLVTKEKPHRIVGLKNSDVELKGPNWFTFAEHPTTGKVWGNSRHENCREEAWWPWMEANKIGGKLDKKASGMVFLVKGPQGGTVTDQNNQALTPQAASRNLANMLTQGISGYCPNALLSQRELKQHPELAKLSAFDVTYFELGDTAEPNDALINKERYYDSLMFRGWKRPERSATEGQRGTLAEAEVHGDIGTDDSDLIRSFFCKSLNKGPVDNTLEQNFGVKARGKVYLKPSPIVPARFQLLRMLMEKAASVPSILARVLEQTDADAVWDILGIPKKDDIVKLKTEDLGVAPVTNSPPEGKQTNGEKQPPKKLDRVSA